MGTVNPGGGDIPSSWSPGKCISRSYASLGAPWKKNLAVFSTIFATVVTGGLALIPIGIVTWAHGTRLLKEDEDKKVQQIAENALKLGLAKARERALLIRLATLPDFPLRSGSSGLPASPVAEALPGAVGNAKSELQKKALELFEKGEKLKKPRYVRPPGPFGKFQGAPMSSSQAVVDNLLKALKKYGDSGNLDEIIIDAEVKFRNAPELSKVVRDVFSIAVDINRRESVIFFINAIDKDRALIVEKRMYDEINDDVVAFLREAVEFVKTIPMR
jgi:hypothetical protein